MTEIKSYRDLEVWQRSLHLVDVCFDIVEALPPRYRFIFCDQLLRSGISIPSNIAEGTRRPMRAYLNHLSIGLGSGAEVETLLEVIRRRKFIAGTTIPDAMALAESVNQMLHALVRSLENDTRG